jgi:hypothetical protein
MAAQIRAHGGVAEERTYGGVGHVTLIGAFAPGLRVLAPVLRDVTQLSGASQADGVFATNIARWLKGSVGLIQFALFGLLTAILALKRP